MARRKRLLISLTLLLLVLSIPTLSLLLSPYIARHLIEQWLEQQGFSQVNFQLEHPGWGSLRVQDIRLHYDNQAYQLSLQSGPVELYYDPYQLLLRRQLKSIELQQPTLKLTLTGSAEQSEALALASLLPAAWLPELPADRLSVTRLQLSVTAGDSQWRSDNQLQVNSGQLQVNSRLFLPELPELTSRLQLDRENHFQFQLNQNSSQLLSLQGQVQDNLQIEHRLQIDLAGSQQLLHSLLPVALVQFPVSGSLTSQGQLNLPDPLQLNAADLPAVQLQQQFTVSLHHQTADLPSELTASLQGQATLQNLQLSVNLNPSSRLLLKDWSLSALSTPLEQARLELSSPLQLHWPLLTDQLPALESLQIEPVQGTLQLSQLTLPQGRINSDTLHWQLDQINPARQALHGKLQPVSLQLQLNKQQLPEISFASDFNLTTSRLQQRFSIHSIQLPLHLTGSSTSQLNTQFDSSIQWQLQPVSLPGLPQKLRPWLRLPSDLNLQQGTLYHQGSARWQQQKLSAELNNRIKDGSLLWRQNQLSGLNWRSDSRLSTKGIWQDKGEVQLQQVTTGVELSQIQARYLFTGKDLQGQLSLQQAEAGFAGGRIFLDPIDITLANPEFNGQLHLETLDLQQLLQLEQQPGLSGEGKLSGSVPLSYRNGELSIANGRVESLAPGGRIRYRPDASVLAYATANKGLAMALQLLQNFHYRALSVDVQYQPDGKALLNTRLQGHNPDWQNGQRVDFNINIEENILQLIKALQLADQLSNRIEQRYRNQE